MLKIQCWVVIHYLRLPAKTFVASSNSVMLGVRMRKYKNVIKIFCFVRVSPQRHPVYFCMALVKSLNWVHCNWWYFPLWLLRCSKIFACRLHHELLHLPTHTESISHGITMRMLISIERTRQQNHYTFLDHASSVRKLSLSLLSILIFLEREFHYVAQDDLKLIIFLHHSSK